MTTTSIGDFDVFFWPKISPVGKSGWVVRRRDPKGGLGEIVGKYKLRKNALALAKFLATDSKKE